MRKFFMTSVALTTMAISMVLFQMSSCKKAEAEPPVTPPTIEGLWIGTYTTDGHTEFGKQYFSFVIKPDGTLINDTKGDNKQHLNIGTWQMNGGTLSCTFTCVYGVASNIGIAETSTASLDEKGDLQGTWKNIPPLTGSGTFSLKKVK